MEGLALIAGLLALTSGSLKMFGKGRKAGGTAIWAGLEILAGGVVPLYALWGQARGTELAAAVFLTLGLILFSSILQVRRARFRQHHREETESARLEVYVKYLSRTEEESTKGSGG